MTYQGHIRNGVVTLDQGDRLPEGARVEVRVVEPQQGGSASLSETLLQHAGTVLDLPDDAAEQLDHYLYGVPKR